jgi:hypothetical protein
LDQISRYHNFALLIFLVVVSQNLFSYQVSVINAVHCGYLYLEAFLLILLCFPSLEESRLVTFTMLVCVCVCVCARVRARACMCDTFLLS